MEAIFLKIANMSITASWLVLAVILLRVLLKKAPKGIRVFMWALVGLRLICPVSIKTVFSLIPSAETLPKDIIYTATPTVYSGISALNSTVNPILSDSLAPAPGASANPTQILSAVAANLWIVGIIAMLIYTLISYISIRFKVREAIPFRENIWVCDRISSPFILGIIKPRIYLPSDMSDADLEYVIAHEKAHLHRLDHLWKPLSFLLLSVYWFNPVIWLAYIMLCRDIELACDERVISEKGTEFKKPYSEALINCSVKRRSIAACPLAFGEFGVKGRIKAVLNYKKPAFWMIVAAVILCIVLTVCFLTDPVTMHLYDIEEGSNLFDEVDSIGFVAENGALIYITEKDFSTAEAEKEYVAETVEKLCDIEISRKPISKSRSEDRDKSFKIELYKDGSKTDIYFNKSYTEVWIDDGVKPSFSYRVLNPEYVSSLSEIKEISSYPTLDADETASKPLLTLEDVVRIAEEKGGALDWSDFEEYRYAETGSGLYIRAYEIDEMFTLSIGGTSLDSKPMYFYLWAHDAEGYSYDIRNGKLQEFIDAHRDNAVVKQVSYGFHSCAVDYSGANYELLGIPAKAYLSSVRALPAMKITSVEELEAFKERVKDKFDFDRSYEDCPSFNDIEGEYNEEFFKTSTLVLSYAAAGTDADRFTVDYVTGSEGVMSIGIAEHLAEAGNDVMQGWLICISIPKEVTDEAEEIEAYISATVRPSTLSNAEVVRTYVFTESTDVIRPTFTLYDNGKFQFSFSVLSSYLGIGDYVLEDGRLTLSTDDGLNVYNFTEVGDTMVFDADASSPLPSYAGLYDGCVFE